MPARNLSSWCFYPENWFLTNTQPAFSVSQQTRQYPIFIKTTYRSYGFIFGINSAKELIDTPENDSISV
jgi:hypothetical protein